jgi:hypothetical protein
MAKSFTTLRTAVVRIVLYAAVERALMLFAVRPVAFDSSPDQATFCFVIAPPC